MQKSLSPNSKEKKIDTQIFQKGEIKATLSTDNGFFEFQWKILIWISPRHLRSLRRRRLALLGFPALCVAVPLPPRCPTAYRLRPPTASEVAVDLLTRSVNFVGWCLSTVQNQFRLGERKILVCCELENVNFSILCIIAL